MTTSYLSKHSLGAVFANIPGILGYYPHHSVLFLTFCHTHGSSYQHGPLLRLDIDDLEYLSDVSTALEANNPDLVFAVVVCALNEKNPREVQEVSDILAQASDSGIIHIDGCWHVEEIYTDAPYSLLFEHSSFAYHLPQWRCGRVTDIMNAPATRELLKTGELPALSRKESLSFFQCRHNAENQTPLASELSDNAAAIIFDVQHDPHRLETLKQRLGQIYTELSDAPHRTIAHEWVVFVATLLSSVWLRDAFLEYMCTHPATSQRICLEIARAYSGCVHHNALCIFAICSMKEHKNPKALHALLASEKDDPHHRLTQLLLTAYRAGNFSAILTAINRGSEMAWRNLLQSSQV